MQQTTKSTGGTGSEICNSYRNAQTFHMRAWTLAFSIHIRVYVYVQEPYLSLLRVTPVSVIILFIYIYIYIYSVVTIFAAFLWMCSCPSHVANSCVCDTAIIDCRKLRSTNMWHHKILFCKTQSISSRVETFRGLDIWTDMTIPICGLCKKV
jgi:hypothetical protein